MKTFRNHAALLALCLYAVSARAQGDFEDEITRSNDAPIIGVRVEEDSWRRVKCVRQMGEVNVPAFEIDDVIYSDATRGLLRGFMRARRGFYTQAIDESLKPALDDFSRFRNVGGQPWARQYVLYYLAYSYLNRGEPGDAEQAQTLFDRLIKEVPDSRFLPQSLLGVADALKMMGKYQQAEERYRQAAQQLESMSRESVINSQHGMWLRRFARQADLAAAQMLEAQENHHSAQSAYERLIGTSSEFPDVRARAQVGVIRAMTSLGNYERAIERASAMIAAGEREGNTEHLGGAYMAVGDSYFARAGADESHPEDLVIARWNYLRVATMFFFERDLLAKARYRAGRCLERLARNPSEGGKERAIEEAKRLYRLTVSEFPGTAWAEEAEKSLQALGK